MLRARTSRREESLDARLPEPVTNSDAGIDPEQEVLLADSVGLALMVVLETLAPAERIAFVLHDTFAVPFDEIAAIVGRSPTAARQLASRAGRRVQGAAVPDADLRGQRAVVEAFLAAARGGDFNALLAVLDPDVVLRADASAVPDAALRVVSGAAAVATRARGGAQSAQVAPVNGGVGVVVAPRGRLLMVLGFKVADGKVVEIEAIADPKRLRQLELAVFDD